MKKIFICFICLILFIIPTFSGCSCTGETILVFNNAFSGNAAEYNDVKPGYTETITYNVSYDKNNYYVKELEINDEILTATFSGTYTQTLTVSTSAPNVESDIITKYNTLTNFYTLTSSLSLDTVYTINGTEYTHTDTIVSKVCFLPKAYSFAPIYSESKACYLIVSYIESTALVAVVETDYSTTYQLNNYSMTKKDASYSYEDINTNKLDSATPETKKYDYKFMTLIDNNELLFALRNTSIEVDNYLNIPTVSFAYGKAKTLSIKNSAVNSENYSFTYTNTTTNDLTNESIEVKNYKFNINSSTASGAYQYLLIQNKETTNVNNLALPCVYAQPIITYGSFYKLGTLVYTLSSVVVA